MAGSDNRRIFKGGFRSAATPARIRARPADILAGITPTFIPWTGWTDVTKYTQITVYTTPLTLALTIGVTLYADGTGQDIYRGAQFVYNNTIYRLSAGVISGIEPI